MLLGLALMKLPDTSGVGVPAVVVTTGVAADGWTLLVRCGAASAVAVPATSSTPAANPKIALREWRRRGVGLAWLPWSAESMVAISGRAGGIAGRRKSVSTASSDTSGAGAGTGTTAGRAAGAR